jgi:hypothetical protein
MNQSSLSNVQEQLNQVEGVTSIWNNNGFENSEDVCCGCATYGTVEFQSNCCPFVTVTCLTKFLFRHLAWRTVTVLKFCQT